MNVNSVQEQEESLEVKYFFVYKIVNKYRTQFRIVKRKNKEMDIFFGRYKIIYVSEDDLTRTHYLNDLYRRELQKGKVGIFFGR